jgi:D-lactate dehydrogenase
VGFVAFEVRRLIKTMRIAIFDTHSFDRVAFTAANERYRFEITFFEPRLSSATASLAAGFPVICPFVNDRLDAGR